MSHEEQLSAISLGNHKNIEYCVAIIDVHKHEGEYKCKSDFSSDRLINKNMLIENKPDCKDNFVVLNMIINEYHASGKGYKIYVDIFNKNIDNCDPELLMRTLVVMMNLLNKEEKYIVTRTEDMYQVQSVMITDEVINIVRNLVKRITVDNEPLALSTYKV